MTVVPAGEAWQGQGMDDINGLLLVDGDGDEAHEFIVIDSPPRHGTNAKGARGRCHRHLRHTLPPPSSPLPSRPASSQLSP